MKIECPKCGFATQQSQEELSKLNNTITCPKCMSQLKIVNGVAYIPTTNTPLEELKPHEEQPPQFKGEEYYNTHITHGNLDPLYDDAISYIKTCNVITLPMLQRYFDITPERAETLMQQLEDNKIVAPYDGKGPRKILIEHNTNLSWNTSHIRNFEKDKQNAQMMQEMMRSKIEDDKNNPDKRIKSCSCALPSLGIILMALIAIYFLIRLITNQ